MPSRCTYVPILALLPFLAAGCHKLGTEQPALQTVTLTGTAVAPADQMAGVLPAGPASLLARRGPDANVPLAYARVEALDAALRPIPGVTEARTDAGGRYTLDVPAGRPYVLRFSVGEADNHLALMALTRTVRENGTQVVNADPASHVATHVLLERSGGLDAALGALGAPELQGVVDFVRRGISGKVPDLLSAKEVGEAVAAEQQATELSPVLARIEAAKVLAEAAGEPKMVTSRVVAASIATPDAPVAAVPVPSPSPSPTAAPPTAEKYKVAPAAEAVAPAVPPPPPVRPAVQRRRAAPEVDPYLAARERARVDYDALLAAMRPRSDAERASPGSAAPSKEIQVRAVPIGAASLAAPKAAPKWQQAGRPRSQGTPKRPAPVARLVRPVQPAAPSAYASAVPQVIGRRSFGPFNQVLETIARLWPMFLPPTGARPS